MVVMAHQTPHPVQASTNNNNTNTSDNSSSLSGGGIAGIIIGSIGFIALIIYIIMIKK
jgi:hypothetical protein